MKIEFFMAMEPPKVTDQEHRTGKRKDGSVYIYKDARLLDARAKLKAELVKHKPDEPMTKGVRLFVAWYFSSKSHKSGERKITKPDTDNLNKMLKDVMTECGYWKDDAQVCMETICKFWVDGKRDLPGIRIELEEI